MLNGYVTFDELVLLTGLKPSMLFESIRKGMPYHRLNRDYRSVQKFSIKGSRNRLFNYQETIDWLLRHMVL